MKELKRYLIVRADGYMRIISGEQGRRPNLRADEIAFPIKVTIPEGWGSVLIDSKIEVTMPEPPQATARIGEPERP